MTNKNYRKGRRKEYKIKHQYEKEGWIVLRSAGSFGFADLIAIHAVKREVLFIQAKPDNFSENKKKEIKRTYDWIDGDFKVKFLVQ